MHELSSEKIYTNICTYPSTYPFFYFIPWISRAFLKRNIFSTPLDRRMTPFLTFRSDRIGSARGPGLCLGKLRHGRIDVVVLECADMHGAEFFIVYI